MNNKLKNMKKSIILTLALFLQILIFSQKTEMIFLDGDFKPTKNKDLAEYYQTINKTDSGYFVTCYFINHQLQMSGLYSDEELTQSHGLFVWYYENGKKKKEAKYVNNEVHGTVLSFFENGNVQSSQNYANNKCEGDMITYYKTGIIKVKNTAKNGIKDGEYLVYFPDGKVYAKGHFSKGNLIGKAIRYYQNDKIMSEINTDESGNGDAVFFNDEGIVKEKVKFVNGIIKDTLQNINNEKNEPVFNILFEKDAYNGGKFNENDVTNFFFKEVYEMDESGFIYDFPDKQAQYNGEYPAIRNYLAQNVLYPKKAKLNRIEGMVLASFIIEIDGSVSSIKILSGQKIFHAEVIRLIENMPNWIPGEKNDKTVRTRVNLPINFKLN